MPLRTPIIAELDAGVWLAKEPGGGCAYFLRGTERGLVIDAGSGPARFEGLAGRIFAGRPFDLVLTRGQAAGEGASVLLPPWPGRAFGLGGRDVLAVWTPGHTPDSCSFLDTLTGLCFTGGACAEQLRLCGPVSDAVTGLMRLRKAGRIARIFPAQLPDTHLTGYGPELLEDAIGACRAALSPNARDYAAGEGRLRFGSVELCYDPALVWAEGEPHSPYPLGL